eukprot:SAG11_NODE_16_length_26235_cov_39.900417_22_plen_74_part_00
MNTQSIESRQDNHRWMDSNHVMQVAPQRQTAVAHKQRSHLPIGAVGVKVCERCALAVRPSRSQERDFQSVEPL